MARTTIGSAHIVWPFVGATYGIVRTAVLAVGLIANTALSQPRAVDLARDDTFRYKDTASGSLELVVNYPQDWSSSDSRAAVVFFYGGGWAYSALDHFERQAKYFASRGMVAVRPDYRVKNRDGATPAESVEDAKSAIRWVRANADSLGIDAYRIVASGGSSGGHLAACTAQCSGPEDVEEDSTVSSAPDALILFNPLLTYADNRNVREAYPVKSETVARQISPDLHIAEGDPPALLMFGSDDVLLDWASTYLDRSRKVGNRVELLIAGGEGHAFFNESPWYERTLLEADRFLVSLRYLEPLPIAEEP